MKKVLVNIVSSQTIPNYLFIKEFGMDADLFLFISTESMEKKQKTRTIYNTAGISKKDVRKINVHEDELYLAKEKLDKLGWTDKDFHFFVNITGGTKLMSNAVLDYFNKFNSRFFYLPIGKNIIKEIFTDKPSETHAINYKITVKEYLQLYNIDFDEEPLFLNKNKTDGLLQTYEKNNFETFPTYPLADGNLSGQQKHALWFEHYLYYKIKNHLQLNNDEIKLGIKLFKQEQEGGFADTLTDNQIDVVFTWQNNCYLIEAKVSAGKTKINTAAITNYMYKLAAINKRFGINAKAALMLFADFTRLSEKSYANLKKRSEILNLPFPFDRNSLLNDEKFNKKFSLFLA
jgi:hypothetical protein